MQTAFNRPNEQHQVYRIMGSEQQKKNRDSIHRVAMMRAGINIEPAAAERRKKNYHHHHRTLYSMYQTTHLNLISPYTIHIRVVLCDAVDYKSHTTSNSTTTIITKTNQNSKCVHVLTFDIALFGFVDVFVN